MHSAFFVSSLHTQTPPFLPQKAEDLYMDLVDFPTEDGGEVRILASLESNKGLKMTEEEAATTSSTDLNVEEEEGKSDQSLYSRIWTYFGSNPKPGCRFHPRFLVVELVSHVFRSVSSKSQVRFK